MLFIPSTMFNLHDENMRVLFDMTSVQSVRRNIVREAYRYREGRGESNETVTMLWLQQWRMDNVRWRETMIQC